MKLKTRIILDILIVLSIAIFPWWFTVILIVVGIFAINNFYEVFVFAIIADSLYSVQKELFFGIESTSFLFVLILFFSIREFKKRLRI